MKLIAAEFARPSRPPRLLWAAAVSGVLAAGFMCTWTWREQAVVETQGARLRAEIQLSQQRAQDALQAEATHAQLPPPYEQSARNWLAERAFAWPAVLRALERVQVNGVVVRNVEATADTARIRVVIDAPNHEAVTQYTDALNAGTENVKEAMRWTMRSSSRSSELTAVQAVLETAGAGRP